MNMGAVRMGEFQHVGSLADGRCPICKVRMQDRGHGTPSCIRATPKRSWFGNREALRQPGPLTSSQRRRG